MPFTAVLTATRRLRAGGLAKGPATARGAVRGAGPRGGGSQLETTAKRRHKGGAVGIRRSDQNARGRGCATVGGLWAESGWRRALTRGEGRAGRRQGPAPGRAGGGGAVRWGWVGCSRAGGAAARRAGARRVAAMLQRPGLLSSYSARARGSYLGGAAAGAAPLVGAPAGGPRRALGTAAARAGGLGWTTRTGGGGTRWGWVQACAAAYNTHARRQVG
jgi:hypothetical protein